MTSSKKPSWVNEKLIAVLVAPSTTPSLSILIVVDNMVEEESVKEVIPGAVALDCWEVKLGCPSRRKMMLSVLADCSNDQFESKNSSLRTLGNNSKEIPALFKD